MGTDHWQASPRGAPLAAVNLAAEPRPAGVMDVVLGPGWPGVLLHEAIGHGLEGDFNRKQTSTFDCDGQAHRRARRHRRRRRHHPDRRGSINVDDEGTPSRRNVLIEDGILVGYMQDRQNARLMGIAPTGNGRRQSYAHTADAADDQHLHARRRRTPARSSPVKRRHLRRRLRRRPGRHHQRQVRLLLHRGLPGRGRQASAPRSRARP